ncbi:MAG TPA: Rrf2 family transcriptional regulator [Chitinophagaceae bacterium]|jgi:Rrf2 family protein|nr:Rrf2 family transcriptional regulator [Chitinophagaceae bacterium]
MLSKSCEYAIRALIYIMVNAAEDTKINIDVISSAIGIPKYFTAKLLQSLSKQRIISSAKGPNGGFFIEPGAAEIPLSRVVEAIDGMGIFTGCVLGLSDCSEEHPCPLHHQYKGIRAQIIAMLEGQNIRQLAARMEDGQSFIKNKNYLR